MNPHFLEKNLHQSANTGQIFEILPEIFSLTGEYPINDFYFFYEKIIKELGKKLNQFKLEQPGDPDPFNLAKLTSPDDVLASDLVFDGDGIDVEDFFDREINPLIDVFLLDQSKDLIFFEDLSAVSV
jgi:hypothetical protein